MKEVPGKKYPSTPLVLIGTGAGCSFLLDFYFYVIGNDIVLQKKVVIYFSTRSIGMFQWFTDITCRRDHKNLFIDAHLTSNNVKYQQKEGKSRESNIGRMNMEAVLDRATNDTQIFYCGSPSIQNMVSKLCEARNLEVFSCLYYCLLHSEHIADSFILILCVTVSCRAFVQLMGGLIQRVLFFFMFDIQGWIWFRRTTALTQPALAVFQNAALTQP